MNFRDTPPYKPIVPPVVSLERSPLAVRRALVALEVTTAPRYAPNLFGCPGTRCNIFVSDATKALGCEVPHVWQGREMNANANTEWLSGAPGYGAGWLECDAAAAWAKACTGLPVVAAWRNPTGIGHVAMLCPPMACLPPTGPRIAQAGLRNHFDVPLAQGFGNYKPRFFAHP